jgi:hypothetical protein
VSGAGLGDLLVGADPNNYDDRFAGRARVVWNATSSTWVVLAKIGGALYFAVVDNTGAVKQGLTNVGTISDQWYTELGAVAVGGDTVVAWFDGSATQLARLDSTGAVVWTQTVATGTGPGPSLVHHAGVLYVVRADSTQHAHIHAFDESGTALPARSLDVDPTTVFNAPAAAVDESTGTLVLAGLDVSQAVVLRRYALH